MEDVGRHQRAEALEAFTGWAVGSGTWGVYRIARLRILWAPDLRGMSCVSRGSAGAPVMRVFER